MSFEMSRRQYAELNGPTTGDGIRLADTELIAVVEKDLTQYGDEVSFGGGKVIRDGMGQNSRVEADQVPDLVITNTIIVDYTGIYSADIAVKDGKIMKIGKAGNPDIMDNIDIIVGVGTEVIGGEGKIVTAGAIDTHIHFISRNRWKLRWTTVQPPLSVAELARLIPPTLLPLPQVLPTSPR